MAGTARRQRAAAPAESAPRLTVDRKTFGFYHNLMGFPEGHRRRDQRLRVGWRLRDGADDRHLRHRPRHPGSGCPPPGSSGPALGSLHPVLPSTGSRCWRGACCSPATSSPPPTSGTSVSSPTPAKTASVTAHAPVLGAEGGEDAGRRRGDRQGGVPARRAEPGLPGRGVASYLFHAYGTSLQFAPGVHSSRPAPSTAPPRRSGCVTSISTFPNRTEHPLPGPIQYLLVL